MTARSPIADGVDPNRNYPNHFKLRRGGLLVDLLEPDLPRHRPRSPRRETAALKGLLDQIGFAFQVNWHSAGEWLLYAEGWQVSTPTADDPIYFALSGNLDEPAIDGFHPGLSSDVLYVTNGETTDYAHAATGALAWTPGALGGLRRLRIRLPRRRGPRAGRVRAQSAVRAVRRAGRRPTRTIRCRRSASRPSRSTPRSDDPYKDGIPGANFEFDYSYGDPQPVQVLAKRSLGAVTLKYRINGGTVQERSDVRVDRRRALLAGRRATTARCAGP